MAASERRRPTAGPRTLTAAASLGAVLLVLALRGLAPDARAEELGGEGPADRVVANSLEPAPTAPPPPPYGADAIVELRRGVETAVANAVREAERRSGGEADGTNCSVAVHVVERASGQRLVERLSDRAVRPASNLKLVTTAAGLLLLGLDATFETPVEWVGEQRGATLHGDLVVRAGGDPFHTDEPGGAVEPRIWGPVERALRARGVERIEGAVLLDDAGWLEPGPGPEWPPASSHWTRSCALSGGFNANGGVLTARVEPVAVGSQARVEVHPEPHGLQRRYGVDTVAGTTFDLRVGATVTAATVGGSLGVRQDVRFESFSHPDPIELFGEVLVGGLEQRGVAVAGGWRRERGAPGGSPLCTLRSPVADVLRTINTESNNGVADQLFIATGAARGGGGTREGAAAATRAALERLGVSTAGFVQVDGSGLSRANRISAEQLTALVRAVLDLDGASATAFRDSLARAGETGTLDDRMRGTAAVGRVRAKTGWIRGTSALSGVALAADGRELVFSILVTYPEEAGGLNTHCWKPMGDAIAVLLAEFGA